MDLGLQGKSKTYQYNKMMNYNLFIVYFILKKLTRAHGSYDFKTQERTAEFSLLV